jgi:selenocysteine lyase/cysteine desulfurase
VYDDLFRVLSGDGAVVGRAVTGLQDVRALFQPDPGYLNTASVGVPPLAALHEVTEVLDRWRRVGCRRQSSTSTSIERAGMGPLNGVDAATVAIGSVVSELVGLVAAALPDGARVVSPKASSRLSPSPSWPTPTGRAGRGAPAGGAPGLRGPAHLVAVSAVQSADGRLADVPAICRAARAAGARSCSTPRSPAGGCRST